MRLTIGIYTEVRGQSNMPSVRCCLYDVILTSFVFTCDHASLRPVEEEVSRGAGSSEPASPQQGGEVSGGREEG